MLNLSVWVYFLHLLRNVTPAYYGLIIIASLALVYQAFRSGEQALYLVMFIFLPILVYVSILSFASPYPVSPISGLSRLFLLSPFILYVFSVRISDKNELGFWKCVIVFSVIASLSLVFQVFVGPISWFAESSFGRAGVDRFASLAGSLTAYGSLLPIPIIAASVILKHRLAKVLVIIILLVGGLISLQKMALGTALLSLILIVFRSMNKIALKKSLFVRLFAYSLLGLLGIFCFYPYLVNQPYFLYFSSVLDTSQTSLGDVSMQESVSDRLSALPAFAMNFWGGLQNAWMGVGVIGASGGLGYPEFPMTHNIVFETILVFGLPLAILFFIYFAFLSIHSLANVFGAVGGPVFVSSASFLLLLIPSIFSGGLLYHPVSGLIFWFSASRVVNYIKLRRVCALSHIKV